jgi:hypothetical protein
VETEKLKFNKKKDKIGWGSGGGRGGEKRGYCNFRYNFE